jgi:hypothetical protein
MAKPIIVVTLGNATRAQWAETKKDLSESDIANEYHVLVLQGQQHGIQVFFEKDQINLDQAMLERLLALAK